MEKGALEAVIDYFNAAVTAMTITATQSKTKPVAEPICRFF